MSAGAHHSITDVSINLPTLAELVSVMTLQAGFNSAIVVIGTTLLGVAAGIIGTFAVLRKRALMGDALAHSSLPGLAFAFITAILIGGSGRSLPVLLTGAAISGVLGVLTVQFIVRNSRIAEEAAIGIVLSVFFGIGIVALSVIQSMGTGREGGLSHFIYGQTAAMISSDAMLMLTVACIAILAALFLVKEFRIVCFDDEFAAVQGWPVSTIDLLMMALVVLVTVIGLQAVGMILIVAFLIIPAAAARFWTERLSVMITLSAFIGGLSGYLGSIASTVLPRLPTGSVIVLVAGALFFISFFFAPARGVLSSAFRTLKLQLRVSQDHLLREIYEKFETSSGLSDPLSSLPKEELSIISSWNTFTRWLVLRSLASERLLRISGDLVSLLPQGLKEAKKLTRNHRLWEQYLIEYGFVGPSHVDYSADMVEHVLSPHIVRELEEALAARGKMPEELLAPTSAHPISGGV